MIIKVWVGGELWNASSDSPIIPGSESVIQDINNLTLLVSRSDLLGETNDS
jgi:membrane protein implicated in regulation of membrane protease activity